MNDINVFVWNEEQRKFIQIVDEKERYIIFMKDYFSYNFEGVLSTGLFLSKKKARFLNER